MTNDSARGTKQEDQLKGCIATCMSTPLLQIQYSYSHPLLQEIRQLLPGEIKPECLDWSRKVDSKRGIFPGNKN